MMIRAVPFVLPLLLLGACADPPVDPGDGGIDHPTGPGDLLVRVEMAGGFVPVEWNLRRLPTFALYGDGTVIVPGAQIEIYPAPALPAISRRTVDDAGIQAILGEALGATDGIPADLGDMGSIGVADAATTVLTIRAGGVDRRIEAYALTDVGGRPDGMPEDVYRARQRLNHLVTRLTALEELVPAGSLGPETAYRAEAARLFVSPYREVEDLRQQPAAWPLGGALGAFGNADGQPEGYRCGTVVGEEWDTLRAVANGANELTPWTDGAGRFAVLFRPLLPDESGCAADANIP